jgi:hypothetical protein
MWSMDEVELEMARRRQPISFGLFDIQPKARASDPATSHNAADAILPRSGTAKARLLEAHYTHPEGLTDREAAEWAGLNLRSEYATRCSELVRSGLLCDTQETRPDPETKAERMVRRITTKGCELMARDPKPARLGRSAI